MSRRELGGKIVQITIATRVREVARVAAASVGKLAQEVASYHSACWQLCGLADEPGGWLQRGGG